MQVVAREVQVAHAAAVEVEEVLAQQRAVVVERFQAQFVAMRLDGDLEQRRPAAQHRPAQAEQQPLAIDGQAFDVEAVVLARDRHERTEMRRRAEQLRQRVRLGVAFQPPRAPAIARLAHQVRRAFGVVLDRQASQESPVGVERRLRQPLGVLVVLASPLRVLAFQPVRSDDPEVAVASGHAFEVGFVVGRTGQLEQLGKREIACIAIAQGFAPERFEPPQPVDLARLVTGHPQPFAGAGGAGEIGMGMAAVRFEFEANGVGDAAVGHHVCCGRARHLGGKAADCDRTHGVAGRWAVALQASPRSRERASRGSETQLRPDEETPRRSRRDEHRVALDAGEVALRIEHGAGDGAEALVAAVGDVVDAGEQLPW